MREVSRKKPPSRGGPKSKADRRSESEDIVAEFLAKGGSVTRVPGIEPTAFACSACGHAGIAGFASGKVRKCPRCRAPLA
jgi:hypothetical protein